MPGKRITASQVRIFMDERKLGKTQKIAAAKAGFSERSARNLKRRGQKLRNWRTRPDPFAAVWESKLVPMLEKEPKLQARTLLDVLQEQFEGEYPDSLLRSLQRRVRQWRAFHGPEKEIIFRQKHPPGWQGISDFTVANELGITVRNEPLEHRLYHFRLPFSGWEYAQVILGGESWEAFAEGLQNALWEIGGVPQTHRTDSLSSAYKNLQQENDFTENYHSFCQHYGMEATRNNRGKSHENGAIESPNRHLKRGLEQALLVRGSRDFADISDYRAFVRDILQRHNRRIGKGFEEERQALRSLPEYRTNAYAIERARVTTSSTIVVRSVVYSVPSRLIGMTLKVHLYDDRLECYVGGDRAASLPRLRRNRNRVHYIDFRHVIPSLMQKPQAFRRYVYRDDLFPTLAFRLAWEKLDHELEDRHACREYVRILKEAVTREKEVNFYLESCLENDACPRAKDLQQPQVAPLPVLSDLTWDLSAYDVLLGGVR